jgi:hypothetical protein
MSSNAVLENVRRYRAIASLYRQTAAFRPLQRHSLLGRQSDGSIWRYRSSRPTFRRTAAHVFTSNGLLGLTTRIVRPWLSRHEAWPSEVPKSNGDAAGGRPLSLQQTAPFSASSYNPFPDSFGIVK